MLSIALVAAGVIDLAACLPRHAPLGPAAGLLAAAALVFAGSAALLARQHGFAWARFGRWAAGSSPSSS
ncbi:MAG TPA: hypothetical protein VFB42_11705 [Gaiellaceae bacterium]|nr:hypothetical protein [Gaiellaceae bacterium]